MQTSDYNNILCVFKEIGYGVPFPHGFIPLFRQQHKETLGPANATGCGRAVAAHGEEARCCRRFIHCWNRFLGVSFLVFVFLFFFGFAKAFRTTLAFYFIAIHLECFHAVASGAKSPRHIAGQVVALQSQRRQLEHVVPRIWYLAGQEILFDREFL